MTNDKSITFEVKLINSVWYMSSSVSSLADNLSERLYKDKCKNCKSNLEYMTAKDKALTFKCVDCNRNYE